MDRLKELLEKVDERPDSEQSRKDSAISTLLRLHFEYIGEPVKCDIVKPFLGSLADPVLQIRIPTPITNHINKCQACRDDLKKLLDLHLPHKYLCHLGQVLADKPVEDEFTCSQVQAAIPAIVSTPFGETNTEILKHLCTCSDCREQLYLHRESIRKELLHNGPPQNGFPCDSVSAADIYDYCLPYGIGPGDDEYIESKESLASHLHKCPKCLAKIQELHRTISNIVERAESGIVTTYDIDGSESYAGLPIDSEMTGVEDNLHMEQPKTINLTARLKEKIPALNIKPLLKVGLAAAAVIAIGFALLFNSPRAKAVSFEQIRRAFVNAKNVYIATFTNKMELNQEIWVSRSLNIYMTKTGEKSVLLDLTNKSISEKNFSTSPVKESELSIETATATNKMMAGFLGLVPFHDLALFPDDIEWNYVGNVDLDNITKAIEKYELIWVEKIDAAHTTYNKWIFLVDSETNRPMKTEFHRKLEGDTEYKLESVMEVKYLSDDEMRFKIKGVFP
ncbi:MAG: hypothetical protein ACYS3S_03890 [Planctomycetota bacterium]